MISLMSGLAITCMIPSLCCQEVCRLMHFRLIVYSTQYCSSTSIGLSLCQCSIGLATKALEHMDRAASTQPLRETHAMHCIMQGSIHSNAIVIMSPCFVGEMIVGGKKVIYADEISTGLDSSTTYQIVRCFRNIVKLRRATILMSLLQPPPETYDLFDDIMLIAEGGLLPLLCLDCISDEWPTSVWVAKMKINHRWSNKPIRLARRFGKVSHWSFDVGEKRLRMDVTR